jgi:hypothetical protein
LIKLDLFKEVNDLFLDFLVQASQPHVKTVCLMQSVSPFIDTALPAQMAIRDSTFIITNSCAIFHLLRCVSKIKSTYIYHASITAFIIVKTAHAL